jgi:hypothetical protein|tara:strand:- start:7214 stop:7366 length:153 start_codon:yes stop_codon:yes gene_type:complete
MMHECVVCKVPEDRDTLYGIGDRRGKLVCICESCSIEMRKVIKSIMEVFA